MRFVLVLLIIVLLGCTEPIVIMPKSQLREGADVRPQSNKDVVQAIKDSEKSSEERAERLLDEVRRIGNAPAEAAKAPAEAPQPRVFSPLLVYTTTNCPPCETFKRENPNGAVELPDGGLVPYVVNDKPANHPQWVRDQLKAGKGYPFFEVTFPNGSWKSQSGYFGKAKLVEWYQSNFRAVSATSQDDAQYGTYVPERQVKTPYPFPAAGRVWYDGGRPATWVHLTQGEHAGQFDSAWLQTLSFDEVQYLHSDAHDGNVREEYVVRPGARYSMPARRVSYNYAPSYAVTSRYAASSYASNARSDRKIAKWQARIDKERAKQSESVAVQYRASRYGFCPPGGC